jgi:Family of unknown function (DUF6184)
MKQHLILIALSLSAACSRNDMNERADKDVLDERHEAQKEGLDKQQEAQREALENAQERQAKALEAQQEQAERNVEQRQEALKAGVAPEVASQMTATAVADITSARCAREQKCGNIGGNKTYASLEACNTTLSKDLRDELNAYDCAGGVVSKELQECISAIREEACNSPLDKLARITACRDSDICKN